MSQKEEVSNAFGKFFSNVGKDLASKIPDPNHSYSTYMPRPHLDSIFLFPTDTSEISKLIANLQRKRQHDNITNIILKALGSSIINPLCTIFNKSLSHGQFPQEMKIAEVIPIYKGKDKRLLTNSRQISLLPVFSKILEKIVHRRLYDFLIKNKLLYISQYGFRNGYSTIHAITELVGNIIKGFDTKQFTLALFIDLSKAFDTLDQNKLLNKLSTYGVRGIALDWFKSYLTNRKLYVKYNDVQSQLYNIEYGIPQGSVLGPLLFLLYTNDMHMCLKSSKTLLFADDTTLYVTGDNVVSLVDIIKNGINILVDWFRANKLTLNLGKTTCVLFKPKGKRGTNYNIDIKIDNEEIAVTNHCKFLGLDIDENLDWSYHINAMCLKLAKNMYLLNGLKKFCPVVD